MDLMQPVGGLGDAEQLRPDAQFWADEGWWRKRMD